MKKRLPPDFRDALVGLFAMPALLGLAVLSLISRKDCWRRKAAAALSARDKAFREAHLREHAEARHLNPLTLRKAV